MSHRPGTQRHRAACDPSRERDRLVDYVARIRTPPTPYEAGRNLGIDTEHVWHLIADDERLDVVQHGVVKLIVLSDDKESAT